MVVTGAGGNVEDDSSVVEVSEEEELGEVVEVEDSVVVDVVELMLLVEELAGGELEEEGSGVVEELELEDSEGDGVSVTFDVLLSSAIGMDGAPLQSTR